MSKEIFAQFLRQAGHKVIRTGNYFWYDIYPQYYHTFMNFPDHIPIQPTEDDLNRLLGITGLAARYTCLPSVGHESFQYTLSDRDYAIEKLSPNVRSKIRRGLKHCSVRRISFSDLVKHKALDMNDETLIRQKRKVSSYNRKYLTRFYETAEHFETAEAWGAFVDCKLAAYLVAFRIEDCAKILHVRSDKNLLRYYTNNALIYTFSQNAISLGNISEISFGLESLNSTLNSLDQFKSSMGFHKKAIGERIVINRYLRPLFQNRFFRKLIGNNRLNKLSEGAQKLNGMLHVYDKR